MTRYVSVTLVSGGHFRGDRVAVRLGPFRDLELAGEHPFLVAFEEVELSRQVREALAVVGVRVAGPRTDRDRGTRGGVPRLDTDIRVVSGGSGRGLQRERTESQPDPRTHVSETHPNPPTEQCPACLRGASPAAPLTRQPTARQFRNPTPPPNGSPGQVPRRPS